MRRETGGNSFISENPTVNELMVAIHDGVLSLVEWYADGPDEFDPAAISVDTERISSGKISVTVSGDAKKVPRGR